MGGGGCRHQPGDHSLHHRRCYSMILNWTFGKSVSTKTHPVGTRAHLIGGLVPAGVGGDGDVLGGGVGVAVSPAIMIISTPDFPRGAT